MRRSAIAVPVVDLVVTGGDVLDGTGSPPVTADIVISRGRVVQVIPRAQSLEWDATETIDATGMVVAPGFIDLHTHADFSLPAERSAETALAQGVTTIVTGNCGWSPFPYRGGPELPRATSNLGRDMTWTWDDASSFARTLRELPPGVNVALQVGHAAVRMAVMGSARRAPTENELSQMRDLVEESLEQGAVGFSTGLIYAPGTFATPSEVETLCGVAAHAGALYSTHMRNESTALLDAVREAINTAERASVRLEISHLKAMGATSHGLVDDALSLIHDARTRGVDVACDVYPYTASSTTLSSRLPAWALDGGPAALLGRLADPEDRHRISRELEARFDVDIDPAGVVLTDPGADGDISVVGASLVDLSERWGVDPAEAALRVLGQAGGVVGIVNHAMDERDVESVLSYSHTAVASDGWIMSVDGPGRPHPRSFGTFARVLARYVRERQILDLPEAIRRMTSLPASRLGLTGRGRIGTGQIADLVVFDPDRVEDRSTYNSPRQLADGIQDVLIAGARAVSDGQVTASRHGTVLTAG